MGNHTKNLSSNTVAFACLDESAATIIIDVILAMASVLRWRPSAKYILIEILARIAEADSFECSHAEFSAAIWPDLSESARKEKFSKWLAKIKEEMKLSLFPAVKVAPPRHKKTEDGAHIGLPTLYQRGAFWGLFRGAQEYALECDLLALPVRMRRISIRAFAVKWLQKYGATPIERVKKTDEIKPAKPTLPCSCACISCQGCSAKAPILPSSLPSSEPVLSVQIEEEKKKIRLIEDELVAIGQRRLNRGDKLSVVDNKINAVSVAARMRIKAAVNRSDGRDDYASEAGARARGRASQEIAVAELRAMKREAEEMGELKHAAKLAEFASALENWQLFRSRKGVTLNGGQSK